MTPKELPRYARTVRYLKPSQLIWRAYYRLARPVAIRRQPSIAAPAAFDVETLARVRRHVEQLSDSLPDQSEEAEALCRNQFNFLNQMVQFPSGLDWTPKDVSVLWRYQLHYFAWARPLITAHLRNGGDETVTYLKRLVSDWIAANPRGSSPGWDAFVISTRLMNWALAYSVLGEAPAEVRESVAVQTDWLLHHLERDVRANHLLKNAQALVVAGALLGNAGEEASRRGMALLKEQLTEQILDDGGHYERSLMYHCQVLEDNLVSRAALRTPPAELTEGIEKMAGFLERMLYPDGGIPQFGDASLMLETPPRTLITLATNGVKNAHGRSMQGSRAEEFSGYYVIEPPDGSVRMTVKAGEPGPAYQLGHAHCDMLSYELYARNRRLIVDSGVFGYDDDKWRMYSRGTSAHNTVRVNGQEQMEYWGRFRVGRRYTPAVHAWTNRAGGRLLHAGHDGFAPYRHERLVYLTDRQFWLVADRITGPGSCDVESYVHADPDAIVSEKDSLWGINAEDTSLTIVPFGMDRAESVRGAEAPLQGWYFPSFGDAQPAMCLTFHRRGACPVLCGYGIFLGSQDIEQPEDLRSLAQGLFTRES